MSTTEAEASPQPDPKCRAHPPDRVLHRFVAGTTSPAENRAIVVHLLRQCGQCSRVLAESGGELLKIVRPARRDTRGGGMR
ncbi:MAG TPA: hypothetical protein VH988_02445 [Thermoanaerobaculia bacterium]|nr:hypothetical protein [Thermoanaerobaculia bacterium]